METAADPPDNDGGQDGGDHQLDRRVSKAVEEEQAFLEYIASLPAMSSENVEAFKKKGTPEAGVSTHESVGGLETLDNLYKLMEHLGRLRRQNSKLQKRLQYLENADPDCDESSSSTRSRRFSSKTKTLTRTVSKDDATTNVTTTVKSKVSKWTKVKEAFRWEKASGGVLLPEAASQDSGLGGGDFHLRPPGDRSSYSVSPADSVLSGPPPRLACSLSTSEDELELDLSDCGQKRRKLSLEKNVHLGVEEDETRRSKSLDGESIESASGITEHHTSHSKESRSSHMSQKVHKTPWSKVKDIIQTRTGSIKKKKGADTDADEECAVDTLEGEDRDYEYKCFDMILNEDSLDPNSEVSQRLTNYTCNRSRRLAPVLTITLPSTEELRPPDSKAGVSPTPSNKNGKPPPSPQVEEKHNRTLMRQKTLEESSKDHYKKQVSSSSAGTSPPTPRRKSKWSKVKNAFLTSTPSPEDIAAHFSNSTPSSPINKCTSFLYDLESDELSSSEFIDENLQENNDNVFIEPADDNFNTRGQLINTQKNLEDLHLRFSNEFHQKLSEWERIRNSGIGISSPPSAGKVSASGLSSGTSSVGEEEKRGGDKRRGEEWDKMKSCRKRESLALQQLGEENLSPDFKKKLEQWERIKAVPVSPTQESSPVLQPQSKKKITDWQRWRPGSSSTKTDNHSHNISHELPEEFSKRLQDWDRIKHGTSVDSDAAQKPANRTPSPGVSHDVVFEHKSRKIQHRLSETKEKWADTGHKVLKSKSHHEMKELAWLEKELHKIEREKQRLERERDKYLEREARLQKMRRAIGSTQQKQEVVIPTSTGVFRFEGISQKFTKKLYEWEKARGIGPEASTIALLDPGYKPQSGESMSGETLKKNGALLLRSKSMGSVVDIAGGGGCQTSVITHQPSSLSLNNMEEIGNTPIIGRDPDSCLSDKEDDYDDYYDGDEPGAVIVDIEDVVEETASPLAEPPAVITEIPVYCYAPAEVTRLIDSSGSENELSSETVQSSYCILQENIDLLDELKKKEDICRRIEIRMENIEEKMQSTANFREKKLGSLSMDEQQMDNIQCDPGEDEVTELHDIKSQLKILDDDQEALKQEEATLQYSFVEHSEQQAVLAQSLVDNMRQLQEVNNYCMSAKDTPDSPKKISDDRQEEALAKVQDLTSQLLTMAERLEVIVGERNKELSRLRETISPHNTRRPYLSKHSLSTDSITMSPTTSSVSSRLPRQSSEELSQLPTMLTSKVLELKRGLTYLCAVSDAAVKAVSSTCNINDDRRKNAEPTEESITFSEMSQEGDGAGKEFTDKIKPHDEDESESGLKSNYEDHLIVGCLTLPALRLRRDGGNQVFGLENESIKHSSEVIEESQPPEIKQEGLGSDPECASSKNEVTTTAIVSEKTDETGQEPKKVKKVKIERQSSKDSSRRTRFVKCTKDGCESAVSNNIRSRRLKRETGSESSLKYEEERDRKSSTSNSGEQSEDLLGAEAIKHHITECTGVDAPAPRSKDTNSETILKAPLVTESTPQRSTGDVNRSRQVLTATGTSEPVDVFVPTTRKIFSPVRRDSKGKASSVISYIVRENAPSEQVPLSPRRVRRRNEPDDKTKIQNKNVEEEDENKRESINFVMPPCWILRETRAQSASPALQRRNFPVPRSREKQTESELTPSTRKNAELKIVDGERLSSQNPPVSDDSLVSKINLEVENGRVKENKFGIYGTPTSPTPPTPPLAKKYSVPNRDNQSGESTDKNSCEIKPQPLRKSRTEIGFPPISPIPGRREVKLSKETAPSIRMIIARYNQKVSESQEMLGSKSPDSGSGSPLPWRSPGAERRVRVQMEKYQDEVRRALQGNEGRRQNFCGEVKKSASASFIRSFDKGSVQDRFGRRPSDSLSERQTSEMRYNGILKSSSAGSIKPGTPVPQRREATTLETIETTNIPPSQCTPPVQDPPLTQDQRPIQDPPQTQDLPPENRILDTVTTTITPIVTPVLETECIEEKISRENEQVYSAEPSGSRALRIKKAKEEFLSRGPGGAWSANADSTSMPSTSEGKGGGSWSQTKNRLSRVSCESEASCEGILVSGEEHRQPFDSRLLVKSASAGMINIDSLSFGSILPESTSNSSVPSGSSEQGGAGGTSKSRFGFSNIASRFRKVKMRRHKEKEREKMETVSTLCRQSLLVDIQKRKPADKRDKVSSKSCPSSPVLQKRESNSSWSISPRRIFKPK